MFILMSAAWSCFSGTEEALLYESLVEVGREAEMTHRNGRLFSARSLFKMVAPLMGAWVASDLLEWQFRVLIGVNAVALVVAVGCLLRLREPTHRTNVMSHEVGIFLESLETIRHEPWLWRVVVNKMLVFIGIFLAWRVSQPLLIGTGMTVIWLGVFDLLGHVMIFTFAWFLGHLDKRFSASRVIFVSALMTGIALLVAGFASSSWLMFLCLLTAIGVGSAREPIFAQMVNERLNSRSRATVLSNLNVLKSAVDIPILFLAGWLVGYSLHWPLFLASGLCLCAILVLPPVPSKKEVVCSTNIP